MKLDIKEPPRVFKVGVDQSIAISDMGSITLEENEQVTFVTEGGAETDFVRKSWGFYAMGSLNGRLADHNLRAALTINEYGRFYIMLVEKGCEDDFSEYLRVEENQLICWLDEAALEKIKQTFA